MTKAAATEGHYERAARIAKWLWDCMNSTTSEEYDTGLLTGEFLEVEQQATRAAAMEIESLRDERSELDELLNECGYPAGPPETAESLHDRVEAMAGMVTALNIAVTGLRAKLAEARSGARDVLRTVQAEQRPWVAHNFGDRPAWVPLLGVVEEVGELAHAHLKQQQGIRLTEDHEANAKDAVADAIIFLCDYASARDWDIAALLKTTWDQVKKRDWKANPDSAHEDELRRIRAEAEAK